MLKDSQTPVKLRLGLSFVKHWAIWPLSRKALQRMFSIELASNAVDRNGHLEKIVSFGRGPFIASLQMFPDCFSTGLPTTQ